MKEIIVDLLWLIGFGVCGFVAVALMVAWLMGKFGCFSEGDEPR